MKKLFIVAAILLIVLIAVGGQSVFAGGGGDGCTSKFLDGKKTTLCLTYIQPNLDPYRVGGYTYFEVTGFSTEVTADGETIIYQIAPDLGTIGSRVSGSDGEVSGFVSVYREVGGLIYFPIDLCKITYQDGGGRSSYCNYPQGVEPDLPADQEGGYSFDQVTGLRVQVNETGGLDIVRIAPNTGYLGSAYLSYEMEGLNVAGFITVPQENGSYRYYPMD